MFLCPSDRSGGQDVTKRPSRRVPTRQTPTVRADPCQARNCQSRIISGDPSLCQIWHNPNVSVRYWEVNVDAEADSEVRLAERAADAARDDSGGAFHVENLRRQNAGRVG